MVKKNKVLILGSGFSAGFAAYACRIAGLPCEVWSTQQPTDWQSLANAFFLHDVPEGLKAQLPDPWEVQMHCAGTLEGFVEKQWGSVWVGKLSSSLFLAALYRQTLHYWDPLPVAELLWRNQPVRIVPPLKDEAVAELAAEFHLVIQTFPSREARLKQPPVERYLTYHIPIPPLGETTARMLYDGTSSPISRVTTTPRAFSVELTIEASRRLTGLSENLPVGCRWEPVLRPETQPFHDESIPNRIFLGRFAEWEPHRLAHEAFQLTLKHLRERGLL